MGIGRRRGSGSGPLLKYDARNGAFYRVDRNASGEVEQHTVADLKAVFDLEQVKTLLGVVFAPTFEITGWAVRPAELTVAPEVVADPADVDVELDPEEEIPA